MSFGGVDILVQASSGVQAGAQETGVADKALSAFNDAEDTIRAVAASFAQTVSSLREAASRPSSVEVEFAVGVSVSGKAILVSGSTEATLTVRLSYDESQQPS